MLRLDVLVLTEPGNGVAESFDAFVDRFESGFNARYVLDALAAMSAKEVLLELVDELAPAQLRPADDTDHLAVVMPMRM